MQFKKTQRSCFFFKKNYSSRSCRSQNCGAHVAHKCYSTQASHPNRVILGVFSPGTKQTNKQIWVICRKSLGHFNNDLLSTRHWSIDVYTLFFFQESVKSGLGSDVLNFWQKLRLNCSQVPNILRGKNSLISKKNAFLFLNFPKRGFNWYLGKI